MPEAEITEPLDGLHALAAQARYGLHALVRNIGSENLTLSYSRLAAIDEALRKLEGLQYKHPKNQEVDA